MADGFFSKKMTGGLKLNMTNVLVTLIIAIVLIQLFAFAFGNAIGFDIRVGPAFIMLAVGIASITSVAIVKKMLNNQPVTRSDIFAILVTMMLALIVMFFLRDFAPEIFAESLVDMQSLIGLS